MNLQTTPFYLDHPTKITLFVEDDLTREFLTDFWRSAEIRIISAGGKDRVKAIVNGASESERGRTIVGLIDLDFDLITDHWPRPPKGILYTDVHEFENYLVDFDALGAISHVAPADIEVLARGFASDMVWWMACKKVLRLFKTQYLSDDYPQDPCEMTITQQQAVDHVWKHPYWKKHEAGLRNVTENNIKQLIEQWGQSFADDVDSIDREWLRTFSGKEIFRFLRSRFPRLQQFAGRCATPTQADESLAKQIARELRKPRYATNPCRTRFERWKAELYKRAGITLQ